MSEILGTPTPEISESHEQIIALLKALRQGNISSENVSYIFDKEDFGGLLMNQTYDRITVEVDDDTVGLRVVHMPQDGTQEVGRYTYRLDTQQLAAQKVTHDYNEHFDELTAQAADLNIKVEKLESMATGAHTILTSGVRGLSGDDERLAAIFDNYDAEDVAIANEYEIAGETDELEHRMLANEMTLYDAFEIVAKESPTCHDLLKRCREALRSLQLTETTVATLEEEIASYNWITTDAAPDSGTFVALLKAVTQLIKENESRQ